MAIIRGVTRKKGNDMYLVFDDAEAKKFNLKAGQMMEIKHMYLEKAGIIEKLL